MRRRETPNDPRPKFANLQRELIADLIPQSQDFAPGSHPLGRHYRRDGMVFQVVGDSDYYGYGDDTAVPDRAEAEHAVNTIAGLYGAA